jgi:glycosyltransferase involved in cell wall biosynthesis
MKKVGLLGYSNHSGGAARALGRWEELLLTSTRIQAIQIYFDEYCNHSKAFAVYWDKAGSIKINQLQAKLGGKFGLTDGGNMSMNIFPTFFGQSLQNIDVDVWNVHWFHGEMLSIRQLAQLKKPIIWTLHDPWLINGIGHYPQEMLPGVVGQFHKLLNMFVIKNKRKLFRSDDGYISPSDWLGNLLIDYGIKQDKIKVIPNPIPFRRFNPIDSQIAKKTLKISPTARTILFGADSRINDKRKGIDLGLELLNHIDDKSNAEILTFGHDVEYLKFPIKRRHVGYIKDDEDLALIYSAADLTLVPSRIDNLPQVMTESLSCGTKVYGFRVGGIETTLKGEFGYLGDFNDMVRSGREFNQILTSDLSSSRVNTMLKARKIWNPDVILKSYEEFIETF